MRRRVSFFAFDPELTKHTKYVSTFLRYFMLQRIQHETKARKSLGPTCRNDHGSCVEAFSSCRLRSHPDISQDEKGTTTQVFFLAILSIKEIDMARPLSQAAVFLFYDVF
jgi:hypothetical protein